MGIHEEKMRPIGRTFTYMPFTNEKCGSISLEEVRVNELTLLSRKAFQNGDIDNYEIAKELLNSKQYPNTYSPSYTIEEAKEILQALTPWKIDWGDSS